MPLFGLLLGDVPAGSCRADRLKLPFSRASHLPTVHSLPCCLASSPGPLSLSTPSSEKGPQSAKERLGTGAYGKEVDGREDSGSPYKFGVSLCP